MTSDAVHHIISQPEHSSNVSWRVAQMKNSAVPWSPAILTPDCITITCRADTDDLTNKYAVKIGICDWRIVSQLSLTNVVSLVESRHCRLIDSSQKCRKACVCAIKRRRVPNNRIGTRQPIVRSVIICLLNYQGPSYNNVSCDIK